MVGLRIVVLVVIGVLILVVIFGAYQANVGGDKKIVYNFDSVAVVVSITMKIVMMAIV